jgi:AcrR family transcriptional regulator
MHKENSFNIWLTAGYELFAEEGHEGIQIERLSRITGLNKSGFYHYFKDRFNYFDKLVEYHFDLAKKFAEKTESLKSFDPEFFDLLVQEKTTVFFDMQLNRNRDVSKFKKAYEEVSGLMASKILPIWREYLGVSESDAANSWEFIRDSFNARITLKTFDHEFIRDFTEKFRRIILKVD